MNAADGDTGVDDDIVYSITAGNLLINGTPSFFINTSTGWISVNVPSLDREEHPMYHLAVRVRQSLVLCVHLITGSSLLTHQYYFLPLLIIIYLFNLQCLIHMLPVGGFLMIYFIVLFRGMRVTHLITGHLPQ